ncbi:aspartyl protease family protein [Cucumis melo var. makuwa]|uniref:Aspartyl protease family protein n=2 Tax=Cucumis melo var. makuwa TaxID=1194695 RepID=A0A5A7UYY6_CUCMM|nr:aspartyl protease family protein [Cucumis melo var. makuwa]
MAMEVSKSLHFPLSLLFLLLPLLSIIVDARSSSFGVGNGSNHEKGLLQLFQNFPWKEHGEAVVNCIFQKPKITKGITTLEMKQRDYCSGKITDLEKIFQNRIILDAINVNSLLSHVKSAIFPGQTHQLSDSQIPISSGARLQTLNYIVTVGIGGQNSTLIVDTGSDLTWVQCLPCRLCYNQQEPLFNPSNSSSFLSLPCSSPTCLALQPTAGSSGLCSNKNSTSCDYQIDYGDGSYSRGELGYEKLTLGKTEIDNFIFGCGRNNKGLFGGASGLMGLARSELSLVSQTSSVFGSIFSYCLPTTGVGSSGSLTLGGTDFSSFKNISPISYTRMIQNPQMSNFYFLNLTGISIGGVNLNVPRLSSNEGVLSLLDSGTVITRLSPSIYKAFKAEFEKQFSGYRTTPGFSILNTCFNLTGYEEVNIPTVKFIFEGNAEMIVDVEGVFYFVKSDASQICLAFASLGYEDQTMIIGNYQQKNQRVVYNSKESKVGFAGEPCSF